MMQHNNTHRSLCALAIVFTIVTIRPVYSKFVLPSRKSLEIIINITNKKIKKYICFPNYMGGCPLIRVCSLIRSNTVCNLNWLLPQSADSTANKIDLIYALSYVEAS